MSILESVTVSELTDLLHSLQLPPDTRIKIIVEDETAIQTAIRRKKALEAMQKLKGSGNGNLVAALLADRANGSEFEQIETEVPQLKLPYKQKIKR